MKFRILKQDVVIDELEIADLKERYLSNYNKFTDMMVGVTDEKLVLALLCLESVGKNRDNIKYRLHTIYTQLRRFREQEGLGI